MPRYRALPRPPQPSAEASLADRRGGGIDSDASGDAAADLLLWVAAFGTSGSPVRGGGRQDPHLLNIIDP